MKFIEGERYLTVRFIVGAKFVIKEGDWTALDEMIDYQLRDYVLRGLNLSVDGIDGYEDTPSMVPSRWDVDEVESAELRVDRNWID